MANEDFVVRFGSNAATFKDQLKRDIVEVNGLVSQLRIALQQGAALKIDADGKLLRGRSTPSDIPSGSGGGGGGKVDEHYAHAVGKLVDNLETYNSTLGGVIRSMDGAARLLEAAAAAVKSRSSGKNRSEAAADREAREPSKSNLSNVRKVHEDALKAALDGADQKDPFENHGNIRSVPTAVIDAAALDRIVINTKAGADAGVATNRKMDHLIGLLNRGLTVKGDGSGGSGAAATRSGGGKRGGTPAEPKGTPDVQDDSFSRVSQLRRFLQKREREQALFKELSRLQSGTGAAPTGDALKTLSGGSKSFNKIFNETGGTGEKYQARVQKAIDSTRAELADVPKLRTLRAQLKAAIEETGTPDGRMPRDQRAAQRAAAAVDGGKKPSTTPGAARAPQPGEDKNTRLQRIATESLAVMKGYQVVVAGLQGAIDDVASGKKKAPDGIDLQGKLAKAKQDLAEAERQWLRASRKANGLSRAEIKDQNRNDAAIERSTRPPQMSAKDAQARLDDFTLAGSPDALRQQTVAKMRQIAQSFRTEGYDVKVPRGAKKDELVDILNKVAQQFQAAGRITNSNLEQRAARQEPTMISPAAQKVIGGLVGKVVQDVQTTANNAIISEAYKGGYSPGKEKKKASAEGAGQVFPVQNNREEIAGAKESLQQRAARIAREATKQGRASLLQDPSFDPYHTDVQVKGQGPQASDARFALRAIRAVVDRFDKLGQAALHVHDDLDKMDKRLQRLSGLESRADYFSKKKNLSNSDREQYTDVLNQIRDLKPRVAADAARRPGLESELAEFYKKVRQDRVTTPAVKMPDGTTVPGTRIKGMGLKDLPDNYFNRQNFGAGLEARNASRDARLTQELQKAAAAAERIQKATSSSADVVAALREALFGARNATNSTGQVSTGVMRQGQSTIVKRVDQRRMLPDVFNEEAIRRDYPSYKREDLAAAQQATNKAAAAIKKQRAMEQENRLLAENGGAAKYTPEMIAAQGKKIEEKIKRLFDAVDKVTGQATAKAEREEARLRAVDPYGSTDRKVEKKNTRTSRGETSVLTSGSVSRAEAIIAGGSVTKDMPMLMGRLARSLGMDYKTDIKGQAGYEGVAGLKRLLAEALAGPKGGKGTADAAAEVKAAAKAGKKSGFDDDCCTKIVNGLNQIVKTLQGGIRFVSASGQEQTGQAQGGPRVAGARRATGATTPEEREARRQRIREEFELAEKRGNRRLGSAREKEQTAAASQTMKEAAAAAELARTLSQLDAVTKGHIQRLKEQRAAGADAATQYKTMQDVYRSGSTALRVQTPTEGVGRRAERMGAVISDAVGSQIPTRDIKRMAVDIESQLSSGILQAAESNSGSRGPLADALFGGKGFMSRVLNSTGTFLVRNFTAGFVFGITNALQDVIDQALETEATFIRVSSALEATGRSPGTLRTGLQQISTDYGVSLKDVYTTASGLTGIFETNEELEAGTRIAAQLESISRGALNSTEAMKALASVTTAFGADLSGDATNGIQTGVEGLSHVADVLTVIQDRMGVNIEDTVEGVGRLAGQAKQLGFNFEEVAVYVAAVSKLTNQSGQASGEQLSRIFSQLQSGPGQAALMKNLGPGSGIGEALGTRNYSDTMDILLEKYNDLGKAQKDEIALALGGARQAAAINALLEQGAKVRDTVRAATDANGQADKRAAEIAETLDNQLKRLRSNFQNLGSAIVRSGLLNALGAALVATNSLLGGFNKILSLVNDFADSNPITRWARDIGVGFLGALVAIKLLQVGITSLKRVLLTSGIMAGGGPAAAAVAARAAAGLPPVVPTPGAPGAPGAAVGQGSNRSINRQMRFLPYANPFRGFGTSYNDRATGSGLWNRSQANRLQADGSRAPMIFPNAGGVSTRLVQGTGVRAARLQSRLAELGSRLTTTAAPTTAGYLRQQLGRDLTRLSTGRLTPMNAASYLSALPGRVVSGVGAALPGAAGARVSRLGTALQSVAPMVGRGVGRIPGIRGLGLGLGSISTQMTRLAGVLQRSALAGAAASAAFGALAIALGAVLVDAMRAREFRKTLKSTFDKDMGNKTEEEEAEEERYSNKYGELVKKNNESLENGFGMGGVRALSRGLKNIGSALTPFADFNESAEEAVGDFSESRLGDGRNVDQAIFKQMQTSFGRLRDINTRSAAFRDNATATGSLLDPATKEGVEAFKTELDAAGETTLAEIEQLKGEINSSDMSDAQKAGALAYLQDIQEKAAELGAKARLRIMGLNSLNVITGQQLDMLTGLMNSVSTGGASVNEFGDLVTNMTKDIGLQEGSDYLANTLGLVTDKSQVGRMEKMQANERLNLQMLDAKLADKNLDPQLREDLTKQAQAALGRYEQMTVAVLQAHITGATALATEMAANGDFAGGVQALQAAIAAAEAEVERQKDDPYQKAIAEANLRTQRFAATELGLNEVTLPEAEARSRGRDQVGNAGSEVREARAVLERYETADSGATAKQISEARIRLNQALIREADALNNRDQASQQQIIAGTLNAATKASLEEALALTQVTYARNQFGEASAEYAQAMGRYLQSQEATVAANEAQTAAAAQTRILNIAPGNAVGIAVARRDEAARAQQAAARFGQDSTQYQQATQALITAQREVNNAVRDISAADADLSIAIADAAGDREASARIAAGEAARLYQVALKEAGGDTGAASVIRARAAMVRANTASRDAASDTLAAESELAQAIAEATGDRVGAAIRASDEADRRYREALANAGGDKTNATVIRADAARIRANAAERDTVLNDSIATIDFQKEIGEISANTAISMLQELLKQTNLTEEQRRNLRLKIKGLQADIRNSLTASGFNIPDQIALPTAYEVRRSLGVDPYVKEGQSRLDDLGKMRDRLAMDMPLTNVSAASGATSTSTQVVNNNTPVTVNNTVSTPAMVEAVARRVVELISTQTSMGARANQTSPALVRY